jgi:MoaA/NifB/PqqE/SkfB family radical SAM enzyme
VRRLQGDSRENGVAGPPKRRAMRYGPRVVRGALRRIVRDRLPLDYLLGRSVASPPSRISVDLTYRCNASCRICCQSGANAAAFPESPDDSGFLDPSLVESLAGEVRGWAPTFYLTGGEPLLHPAAVDIVKAVKRRGLYCSLNTNGSRLAEMAEALAEAGLDKLIVSVDVSAEAYETGRNLSYRLLGEGVRRALEAGRRLGRPRISLNCVVSPQNYASLSGVRSVARDLGVPNLSVQHLMFSSPSLIEAHARRLERFCSEEVPYRNVVEETSAMNTRLLAEEIAALTTGEEGLKVRVVPSLKGADLSRYYSSAEAVIPGRCIAPWTTTVILPSGDVSICPPVKIGNLGEEGIGRIWNSSRARKFRQLILDEGLLPDCSRCCARQFASAAGKKGTR